jgi:hypothetical protein
MWSTAQIELGLSAAEFWQLTPRQFAALLARKREQLEYHELLMGVLAATIANYSFGAPKKPRIPADFMPSQLGKRREEKPKRVSRAKVADQVRAIFGRIVAKQG